MHYSLLQWTAGEQLWGHSYREWSASIGEAVTHRAVAQEAARRAAALQSDAGQGVGLGGPVHCSREGSSAQHDQRGQHGPHGQPREEVDCKRDVGGRHHSEHNKYSLQQGTLKAHAIFLDGCRHMAVAAGRAILQPRSL